MELDLISRLELLHDEASLLFIVALLVSLLLLILVGILSVRILFYQKELKLFKKYLKTEVTNFINTKV